MKLTKAGVDFVLELSNDDLALVVAQIEKTKTGYLGAKIDTLTGFPSEYIGELIGRFVVSQPELECDSQIAVSTNSNAEPISISLTNEEARAFKRVLFVSTMRAIPELPWQRLDGPEALALPLQDLYSQFELQLLDT